MVMKERVTLAVVAVLVLVGGWFGSSILANGLAAQSGGQLLTAALAIAVLTSLSAGAAALMGGRKADERDDRIALRAQVFRGFLYLILSFGLLGAALAAGDHALVNAIFLAILLIEIVSGLVMLALYRIAG